MIADEQYEEKEKAAEAELLAQHMSKLTKDQKLECLDIEMDLETEQAKEVDASCLPSVHVDDIPVMGWAFCDLWKTRFHDIF